MEESIAKTAPKITLATFAASQAPGVPPIRYPTTALAPTPTAMFPALLTSALQDSETPELNACTDAVITPPKFMGFLDGCNVTPCTVIVQKKYEILSRYLHFDLSLNGIFLTLQALYFI
jgi:hypothetical protein